MTDREANRHYQRPVADSTFDVGRLTLDVRRSSPSAPLIMSTQLELSPLPIAAHKTEPAWRERVRTSQEARELYLAVLHEPATAAVPGEMSNLEAIVRRHVRAAREGDARAREQMFDRLWGKAMQPVTGVDGGAIRIENSAAQLSDDELARIIANRDD